MRRRRWRDPYALINAGLACLVLAALVIIANIYH